jgi:hypothetical protein
MMVCQNSEERLYRLISKGVMKKTAMMDELIPKLFRIDQQGNAPLEDKPLPWRDTGMYRLRIVGNAIYGISDNLVPLTI